jgi:LysM repeat protein
MKVIWDGFFGLAAAITSTLLVLGAMTLAMTEGMMLPQVVDTPTVEPTSPYETVFAGFPTSTPRPSATKRQVSLATPTVKSTCPVAAGWEKHIVLNGETLASLAVERGVSTDEIRKNNCLDYDTLVAQSILYLPPLPPTPTSPLPSPSSTLAVSPSATSKACGVHPGWVRYTIRRGDTIYGLSLAYGISMADLRYANCLTIGDVIIEGRQIWVPNVAPRYTATSTPKPPSPTVVPPTAVPTTPVPFTPTFTRTYTTVPTLTYTPIPATRTYTATPINTTAPTNTAAPTHTSTPLPTATFTRTNTATPTHTSTPPAAATFTHTPTPTGTNPATNTSTPTATPTPTSTSTGN